MCVQLAKGEKMKRQQKPSLALPSTSWMTTRTAPLQQRQQPLLQPAQESRKKRAQLTCEQPPLPQPPTLSLFCVRRLRMYLDELKMKSSKPPASAQSGYSRHAPPTPPFVSSLAGGGGGSGDAVRGGWDTQSGGSASAFEKHDPGSIACSNLCVPHPRSHHTALCLLKRPPALCCDARIKHAYIVHTLHHLV